MKSVTEILFEKYQRSRKTVFSFDQFKNILRLFPSLLVCLSDGTFNREERVGMLQNFKTSLLHQSGQITEEVLALFIKEVDYLASSQNYWKHDFLTALKYELMHSPDDKEFIMESLYLFANINNGICDREQDQIDELVSELSLAS